MTSQQLASMIVRRTPWKTLSQLPMGDANALCASINQALQVWFEKANATHTALQQSAQLHASGQYEVGVTGGSAAVTFTAPPPWLSTATGSTLQISGDGRWNRLMSAGTLLHPYAGASGTAMMTLYHDCAPLGSDTISVCSHVKILRSSSEIDLPNWEIPTWWLWEGNNHRTGSPDRYQIEPLNPGCNSTPFFVLRVWPMPAADVTLAYRIARHFSLSLADLQTARALPVPEDVASGILLPIALDRAAGQALLTKDTDFKRVAEDSAAAVARISPRTMAPTTDVQWMGTCYGF